ncbi:MAG: GNAT family N-acetyltransferase [Candidatus Heimdallarchaeaceae archaeon]
MGEIEFREIKEEEHFEELEDIQREAWGMPDLELVPRRLFKATQRSGAVVIGAFAENLLVGYCWGWVGRLDQYGTFIYSHHNAVRKTYQNQGLGYKLKIKQREWAIEKGFSLINWTFDALQSKNCYLNLHKLGAICNTYKLNYWGEMHDAENIGIPTDRFYCNWHISSEHVKKRLNKVFDDYSELLTHEENHAIKTEKKDDLLHIIAIRKDLELDTLFVQIPCNINMMRKKNQPLAIQWRLNTREVFQHYFTNGYTAVDFVVKKDDDMRCYHVLKRNYKIN